MGVTEASHGEVMWALFPISVPTPPLALPEGLPNLPASRKLGRAELNHSTKGS